MDKCGSEVFIINVAVHCICNATAIRGKRERTNSREIKLVSIDRVQRDLRGRFLGNIADIEIIYCRSDVHLS